MKLNLDIQELNDKLSYLLMKCEESFIYNLDSIRSSRISIDFLKNLNVSTSRGKIKLISLASLRSTSTRELTVTSFNKQDVNFITKALLDTDLGLRLEKINNEIIYLSLSPTTEEIRKKLILKCKDELENAKILLRNSRQKIFTELKNINLSSDQEKRNKKILDDIIDKFNVKLTEICSKKVSELKSL